MSRDAMNEALPSLYELFAEKLAAHPELLRVGRGFAQWRLLPPPWPS